MAKTVIRENNVLAIETRTGLFVIAQALKHKTLVFFNLFTTDPLSFQSDLNEAEFLCIITPTKGFFHNTEIIKLEIKPAEGLVRYRGQNRLKRKSSAATFDAKVYENTSDEVVIPCCFLGELKLVDSQLNTLKLLSKEKDSDIIYSHQLDSMGVYGELNEKLYLSYRYGKYVEPWKDFIMGNPPLEYKVYFQIAAQKIDKDEWAKLPIEAPL
jgi:hypothetical protein